MGRSLGPILRQEFENLDKDADSRKSAMKVLKSYVKDLDSQAIPLFLAQVTENKETGSSAGECTISLYEVLARVHGPKILPQIDNIMTSIISTLTSSAGSFALHQACSKVVPAIARYGIDPTTPEDKKRSIIHSLCKPLSDSLLVSQENLSSGAALCLKALVNSDNWRFASSEMVNEVCQRVAGALEKNVQTSSHMGLVMALAKNNSLVVEAYARLLIQSGLRILNAGVSEGNSQKRLSAIQMVNFLMKCLDSRSIFSELGLIVNEMEKRQYDQMAYVKVAAFEALQTAKKISAEKGFDFEGDIGSKAESNVCTRNNISGRNLCGDEDQSPLSSSPESQTIDSFAGYDTFIKSPFSNNCASGDLDYDKWSVNRKLRKIFENGDLNVSLKDGLFSEATPRSVIENSQIEECSENMGDHTNEFAGFFQSNPRNSGVRSSTPSPQRSRSHINVDYVKILTTPRKLIYSLQDPDTDSSDESQNKNRRFRSPCISKFESSPASQYQDNFSQDPDSMYDQYDFLHNGEHDTESNKNLSPTSKEFHGSSELVSSSEYVPAVADVQLSQKLVSGCKSKSPTAVVQKDYSRSPLSMVCLLFIVLFAFFVCLLWIGSDEDEGYNLPPT